MAIFDFDEMFSARFNAGKIGEERLQYHLATAEIFYHMPDHPDFLQSYIWQEVDMIPHFPVLRKFLDFWHHNLDGKLHSVTVASAALTKPHELRMTDCAFDFH